MTLPISWHIESRLLSSLQAWPDNPRKLTKRGLADLKKSIGKFGLAEPIVINVDGLIVGGHARYEVLKAETIKEVECYIPSRLLSPEEVSELNIRLNKNIAGEWDLEKLSEIFDPNSLVDWGFDPTEIKLPDFSPVGEEEQSRLDKKSLIKCPECGHEF